MGTGRILFLRKINVAFPENKKKFIFGLQITHFFLACFEYHKLEYPKHLLYIDIFYIPCDIFYIPCDIFYIPCDILYIPCDVLYKARDIFYKACGILYYTW